MALRRACQIEWAAHRIEFSDVIERMHFCLVEIFARFHVGGDGPFLPAVPETLYDFDKFRGRFIPGGVVHRGAAEVPGSFGHTRGHDIPTCATATQLIE